MEQSEIVGWICLVVGVSTLVAGVVIGLRTKATVAPAAAAKAIEEAKSAVASAKTTAENSNRMIAAGGAAQQGAAGAATAAAGEAAAAAESALQQVEAIIGSLPENVRFAGLLVLVGTVLMSIATIQFGGVSLF